MRYFVDTYCLNANKTLVDQINCFFKDRILQRVSKNTIMKLLRKHGICMYQLKTKLFFFFLVYNTEKLMYLNRL